MDPMVNTGAEQPLVVTANHGPKRVRIAAIDLCLVVMRDTQFVGKQFLALNPCLEDTGLMDLHCRDDTIVAKSDEIHRFDLWQKHARHKPLSVMVHAQVGERIGVPRL